MRFQFALLTPFLIITLCSSALCAEDVDKKFPEENGGICQVRVPQAPPEWRAYSSKLVSLVDKKWKRLHQQIKTPIIVRFEVTRNGMVHALHIVQSSGIRRADKRAGGCIAKAAPFDQLPLQRVDPVEFEFTFEPDFVVEESTTHGRAISPELEAYRPTIAAKIKRCWEKNWHQQLPNYLILSLNLMKNGTIKDLHINQSSGSRLADRVAIGCVRKSAPFAALPSDEYHHLPPEYVPLKLRFAPNDNVDALYI
jgi:hypothetical protein